MVIDAILDQQDALAVLPTGYGKSICYQVASLLLDGVTFVVSPLIALMNEQVGSLVQTGVRAAYINSSLTPGKIRTVLKRIAEGWYDIVYLSPERLSDPVFVEFAQTLKINLIAIDEAHCISRWGHDFRPSYLQIIEFIEALENRPVVAGFTATATARVQQDICDNLRLKDPVRVTESYDRPNLYFDVKHLKPSKKRSFIVHYAKEHAGQTGIVYCMTRKNVEQLTEELQENGVKAAGYHAGMDMGTRQKNREDFLYDRIDVIVATNAFGMGINKPDVRYVIHLNMPSSLEDYYQEAGRAGRDGERAECILLFTRQDIVNIKNFFLSGENGSDHRSLDERKLNDIVRYCQTTTCLRRFILKYFGEEREEGCGFCSNCTQEFIINDYTEESKMILQCIKELPQSYGIMAIADLLKGSKAERYEQYQFQYLTVRGALNSLKKTKIIELIHCLEEEDVLRITEGQYPVLIPGPYFEDVLNGTKAVSVRETVEIVEEESTEKTTAKEKDKGMTLSDLDDYEKELYEDLRMYRYDLASRLGIPPFHIFSNRSLVDICRKKPVTPSELLEVFGFGSRKVETFGEGILNRIKAFKGEYTPGQDSGGEDPWGAEKDSESISEKADLSKKKDTRRSNSARVLVLRPDQIEHYQYTEKETITISDLCRKLTELKDENQEGGIMYKHIAPWLVKQGDLIEVQADNSKLSIRRVVSPLGIEKGFSMERRVGSKGEYEVVVLNIHAQKYIIEHIDEIRKLYENDID